MLRSEIYLPSFNRCQKVPLIQLTIMNIGRFVKYQRDHLPKFPDHEGFNIKVQLEFEILFILLIHVAVEWVCGISPRRKLSRINNCQSPCSHRKMGQLFDWLWRETWLMSNIPFRIQDNHSSSQISQTIRISAKGVKTSCKQKEKVECKGYETNDDWE